MKQDSSIRRNPAFGDEAAMIQPHDASRPVLRYPPVDIFEIASRFVDQRYRVLIACPPCAGPEVQPLPVLYATDANLTFPVLRGISLGLRTRFVLVGIGYPSEMPLAGARLRARDFTFPGYPELGLGPSPIEGVLLPQPGSKSFGGADDFLDFIERELMPSVEGRLGITSSERGYFGHSGGAGFGLYAMCTRPNLFNRLLLSSPGLYFHGTTPGGTPYDHYDFVMPYALHCKAAGGVPEGTKLYLSAGSEEDSEENLKAWHLTSSVRRFATQLEALAIPGLTLISEILEGETHDTVWPFAFSRGVRRLYDPGSAQSA